MPHLTGPYVVADRLLRPVEAGAAMIGAAMMFAAMVLTTLDALLRYSINRPLNFNLFLTENYLMVGLVCLPMAWAFRTGGYIRISFLLNALPKFLGNMLLRAGLILSALYCFDLALMAGENWLDALLTGESEMGVIDWPWHWSWLWVPLGLGLVTLRLLLTAVAPESMLTNHEEHQESAT